MISIIAHAAHAEIIISSILSLLGFSAGIMFLDPSPSSSKTEQDESFVRLRSMLQKQIELSIQVQAMNGN